MYYPLRLSEHAFDLASSDEGPFRAVDVLVFEGLLTGAMALGIAFKLH